MKVLGLRITVAREEARRTWRRTGVVAATATAAVLGGGTAFAYWSASGTGSGAAVSGTAQPLTLTASTTATNLLYPGSTGDVVITISNPNPFNVSVSGLALPATAATAYTNAGLSTLNSTCNTNGTGVAWSYASKSLSGVIVGKKVGSTNGALTLTLTNGATMANSSDNSCQGSFFQMPAVSSVTAVSTTATPVSTVAQ